MFVKMKLIFIESFYQLEGYRIVPKRKVGLKMRIIFLKFDVNIDDMHICIYILNSHLHSFS